LRSSTSCARGGSALLIGLFFLLVLAGLAAALGTTTVRFHGEHGRTRDDLASFCVAEAGLNEVYSTLAVRGLTPAAALDFPRELGAGTYAVELVDGREDPVLDLDRVLLRSVGGVGRTRAGVQLIAQRVPTGSFVFAAFGTRQVTLDSNVEIDSYDSTDGPYGSTPPSDWGNIGSFGTIELDSNITVLGDALVGPSGLFDDDAPGIVVTGDQEARDLDVELDAVAVPAIVSSGTRTVSGGATLAPGDYHFDALTVDSGTLRLQGPARLVVDDFVLRSNTSFEIDATGGPVEIFATGDFELRSNSSVITNTDRARDVSLSITSSNTGPSPATIEFNSNAAFTGTIYAPAAEVRVASNFEVFGAIKADAVDLSSNTLLHFDEELLYDPDAPEVYARIAWRRLSAAEVRASGL